MEGWPVHQVTPFPKLGGFAPEWVALLRNKGRFYPQNPVILPILGGFAPEELGGFCVLKLGGNAPVHPDKDSLLTLENCIDVSHYYKNCSFSHQIKLFSDVNYDEDIFLMSFGKNVSSVQGKGVRCGNDVIFNDIGSSILYLPVIYRKRSYVPIGHPFMIEDDGMVVTYDGGESHELRMAEAGLNQKWLYRMQTGYFEGSNYCDFREGEILYKIEDRPLPQYNTIKLNQVEKYRFLRYVSPPKGNGNIAELEFYYEKQKISGTPIGIEGSWYDNGMTKDKVFDGDIDTYFDAPQGNGDYAWVGLDLTDQCYIDEIRFVPRLTNNNIILPHNRTGSERKKKPIKTLSEHGQ